MPANSNGEIVRGNQVIFTSPRLDLNAVPVPDVRDVGDGELEIIVRASSRPNYVQVEVMEPSGIVNASNSAAPIPSLSCAASSSTSSR
jgi:hypothetical protein